MSYTAEETYRQLYSKTTEEIISLLKATGIAPSSDYDDHPHATFFDMGVLHLMNRLYLSDLSRVINDIEDCAQRHEPETIWWNYDVPANEAAELAAEGIPYSRALVMCNAD